MADLGAIPKHKRDVFNAENEPKGLYTSDATESIPDRGLVDIDGFVIHMGLLRKDWSLIKCTDEIVNNIGFYLDTSLPVCSSPGEKGEPTVWPSDPPEIEENPDTTPSLEWFSYFSGDPDDLDTTVLGGSVLAAEVMHNSGPVTFTIEEYID